MPTPRLGYLFVTEKAIQDGSTGKSSYIDVFETIVIPKELNFFVASFSLVGKVIDVPAGLNRTEVQIIDPDGNLFVSYTLTGELEEGNATFAAQFFALRFEKIGRYHLRATHNGNRLSDANKFFFMVEKESHGRG